MLTAVSMLLHEQEKRQKESRYQPRVDGGSNRPAKRVPSLIVVPEGGNHAVRTGHCTAKGETEDATS